jgi:hypothetical protein
LNVGWFGRIKTCAIFGLDALVLHFGSFKVVSFPL